MIRGCHECLGRAFSVADNKLREIYEDGTWDERGTLLTRSGTVALEDNGQQLVIVDGPNGYILKLSDNSFDQITSDGWRGSDTVCFIDGYFIFQEPNKGIFYISALYDGNSEDALDFASAEGRPDNVVAVAALHQELWVLGTETVQVYDDTGDTFPFTALRGAFIEYGCAAPHSVDTSANTIFWLGKDKEGQGVVWMATGYNPQRISTFAVEFAIQQMDDISDAIGFTYQEDGHYFYFLTFPSGNQTWVYDINLQLWHQRAYHYDGKYSRHRANCHMFAFGKHLVGDYETNQIYEMSLDLYDDNGQDIRWERTSPHLSDPEELEYNFYHRLQVDMQTGVGLTSGTDSDPQVMLTWSDDGGHTWSQERWVSAGKVGVYKARAIWRMLGRARDRVFRIAGTAKCRKFIIAANAEITKGMN